jgi:type VI secretion system protein ImpM
MPSQPLSGFGYFGKVPARGDFIQGNLPADFIGSWSEWLQAVIAVSREQLGDKWLNCYLTSPIWHFALSADVCGDSAMVGTLMPSVDQVGRHFYFTIARPVAQSPVTYWQQREWSLLAEEKVLRVLDDDTDMMRWAEGVEKTDWFEKIPVSNRIYDQARNSQQLVLIGERPMDAENLLHHQLRNRFDRYCMWWTAGSEHVPESCLISDSMPLVSQFSAMLDGQWEQWGW